MADEARTWLAGYYAHCTAIDKSVGDMLKTLDETGQADNTIVVFASDHGDMLGSQGQERKQRPWDESIRVPFLMRVPGQAAREVNAMLNAHDIMPTLLSLCGLPIPATVEGRSFASVLDGGEDPSGGAVLLACFHPFGEYTRDNGGREYRGVRTHRYTYTRTLDGPWLLYDNQADPYQMTNLIDDPAYGDVRDQLDRQLQAMLDDLNDEFLDGMSYIQQWGYPLDDTGTVPYTW
jgi:arylsulfatase A-like enzyme